MPRRAGLDRDESGVDDLSDTDERELVGDEPLFDEEDEESDDDTELESEFQDDEDE